MRNLMFVGPLLVAACGSKGDDCEQVWDKMSSAMGAIAKQMGKPMPASAAKDKFLKECRTSDKVKGDPVFACIKKASGNDEVAKCMGGGLSDYKAKSQMTEAKLELTKLGKNLKVSFLTDGTFPAGKAGPTPAGPCCSGPDKKCAVVAGDVWAADPVWNALEFQIDEPTRFTYRYESDGTKATATAVGDLDCDGTMITYELEANAPATPDGSVTTNLVEPAPDAD